jgi:hypothetical protein
MFQLPRCFRIRTICRLLFVVWIVLLCADSVFAYSDGGHKLAASIAFRRLTPEQRAKVVAILEHHPRFGPDFRDKMPQGIKAGPLEGQQEWLFQQAAIWPDLARSFSGTNREQYHRPLWHFINRPLFLQPEDEVELRDSIDVNLNVEPPSSSIDTKAMNVVQAIVNSSRVFSRRRSTGGNEGSAYLLAAPHDWRSASTTPFVSSLQSPTLSSR